MYTVETVSMFTYMLQLYTDLLHHLSCINLGTCMMDNVESCCFLVTNITDLFPTSLCGVWTFKTREFVLLNSVHKEEGLSSSEKPSL